MKLSFILLFCGILGFTINAQETKPLSIIDPGELYSTYDLSVSDKDTLTALFGTAKFETINNACHENQWPSGIANLEARNENRDLILQYHISPVISIGDISIIEIKPSENKHLPANMQSVSSFYFVIGSGGLGTEDDLVENDSIGNNEESIFEDEYPQVLIVDPGQLISGYTFSEEEVMYIKELYGDEGYEFINNNCREDAWPEGMNSLEKRLEAAADIKLFIAFLVASIGDSSILEITPEENPHVPAAFQPSGTFYIVIKNEGIEIQDY
jgi:hypothetical protein